MPKQEESLALSQTLVVASNSEIRKRLFDDELAHEVIHIQNLRRLTTHGVPEGRNLRSLAWKLILGLLPPTRSDWDSVAQAKRQQYADFCKEVIVAPNDEGDDRKPLAESDRQCDVDITDEDHPLAVASTSKWSTYFKDKEIMDQIERDVMRTHPDLHFFGGDGGEAVRHRNDIMRALFVFAKLNPGVTYVQGMNEIYAPLYYVFSEGVTGEEKEGAGADAFFCFVDLMGEFRDNFCKQLDNSGIGIQATMSRLSEMLRGQDHQLWDHLENKSQVNPQYYAFRWITLLLTQEFNFPDVLRLWDTMIGAPMGRLHCLLNLCVAMLLNVRSELLNGDFSENLRLLQNYPPVDVGVLIQVALELPPS